MTKIFNGGLVAIDRVSFNVEEGEIFGFLGPNGAGKTTTVKILSTLLRPTSGMAKVCGYDVVKQPDKVRRSIGIVFQEPALDDRLTGRENLDFHARMYGMNRRQRERRIKEVLELVGLTDRADDLVKNYSGGMKRRLELARGLMHSPKVLFLDEPTLGLDAQSRRAIWDYVLRMNREEGVTIFLTTHYLEEAEFLAKKVAIIDKGKIIALDTPSGLKDLMGRDVITLSCTKPQVLVEALKGEGWVKDVKLFDSSHLSIYVERGEGKVPKVVKLAEELGVEVASISLRKPTLEDVFIHLTGKAPRDEEGGKVGWWPPWRRRA